jgi:hypothetical protein
MRNAQAYSGRELEWEFEAYLSLMGKWIEVGWETPVGPVGLRFRVVA